MISLAWYTNPAAMDNRKIEQSEKNIFLCTISIMTKEKQKNICDICEGTGQISFFQGVSRFLLSTEECSECAGTGYQLDSVENKTKIYKAGKPPGGKVSNRKKKK